MLRQAFREAISGCPAPTHLAIAGLIGNITMGEMDDDPHFEPRFATVPAFHPSAEPDDIATTLAALAAAERPTTTLWPSSKARHRDLVPGSELVEFALGAG